MNRCWPKVASSHPTGWHIFFSLAIAIAGLLELPATALARLAEDAPVKVSARAVGGLSSVLLSARPSRRRADSIELTWTDAIPGQDLSRYRVLRAGGVRVDDLDAIVAVLACTALMATVLRRRRGRGPVLALTLAAAAGVWAADSQFWVVPSQVIGYSTEKTFVDSNPLPGYNTYRVVAERGVMPELASNTAGAFVGGGNGFTVEPLDRLADGAGGAIAANGNVAVVVSEGSTGAPTAYVVQYNPFDVLGSHELPGPVVSGSQVAITSDSGLAWITSRTGTDESPSATVTRVNLLDGTAVSSAALGGTLIEGIHPVAPDANSPDVVLLQRPSGRVAVVAWDPTTLQAGVLETAGTLVAGVGPAIDTGSQRLVAAVLDGTGSAVLVVDLTTSTLVKRLPVSGKILADTGVTLDQARGLAYVPLRRTGPSDVVVQIDVATGQVKQTLTLNGKLFAGNPPMLADQGRSLVVAISRANRSDAIHQFSALTHLPARSDVHVLPGELDGQTRPALSTDSSLAAILSLGSNGAGDPVSRMTLVDLVDRAVVGSTALAGGIVGGVSPVFDAEAGHVLAMTQLAATTTATSVTTDGAFLKCAEDIPGTLAPELGPKLIRAEGTALLGSAQSPTEDRVTLVRGLPEGMVAAATRSVFVGSRLSVLDFECGPPSFLLFPGAVFAVDALR